MNAIQSFAQTVDNNAPGDGSSPPAAPPAPDTVTATIASTLETITGIDPAKEQQIAGGVDKGGAAAFAVAVCIVIAIAQLDEGDKSAGGTGAGGASAPPPSVNSMVMKLRALAGSDRIPLSDLGPTELSWLLHHVGKQVRKRLAKPRPLSPTGAGNLLLVLDRAEPVARRLATRTSGETGAATRLLLLSILRMKGSLPR